MLQVINKGMYVHTHASGLWKLPFKPHEMSTYTYIRMYHLKIFEVLSR